MANEQASITVDVPKFKEVETLIEHPDTSGPATPTTDEPAAPVDHPSSFTGRRKIAIGVGSAGVLATAAGIVFSLQAKGFEDDALRRCPSNPCSNASEANALLKTGGQRALFANISYGVAGAAVVAAAVLWFTGGPDHSDAPAAIAPVVSPTSAGLAILGRF